MKESPNNVPVFYFLIEYVNGLAARMQLLRNYLVNGCASIAIQPLLGLGLCGPHTYLYMYMHRNRPCICI